MHQITHLFLSQGRTAKLIPLSRIGVNRGPSRVVLTFRVVTGVPPSQGMSEMLRQVVLVTSRPLRKRYGVSYADPLYDLPVSGHPVTHDALRPTAGVLHAQSGTPNVLRHKFPSARAGAVSESR